MSREMLISVLDVLLVSALIYKVLSLIRGPRARLIVMGGVIFLTALFVSRYFKFVALEWVLVKALILAPVALVILLLPELRQGLESFGKLGYWSQRLSGYEHSGPVLVADAIVEAVTNLAELRVGALIVIERGAPLDEIVESGIPIDAKVSSALLESIFYSGNPLHDGAVIIRGDRIVAAASRLPFSESPFLSKGLHMRHRAAVGVTEHGDCVSIVVSEERGTISYAEDGQLRRVMPEELRTLLVGDGKPPRSKVWNIKRIKEKQVEAIARQD